MRRANAVLISAVMLVSYAAGGAAAGKDLETIAPEQAGWSSEKLDEAARYAGELGYTALVLAHDGRVFYSWGKVDRNYKCHSIRKPLLSVLYGIYVGTGAIDLDRTLGDLGIDDLPPPLTDDEKQATIRDLLMSRSGVYHEAAAETESMAAGRPARGSHPHGTFFYYNNWDYNALGTIFRQLTGKDIFEEFEKRIADPIGMRDFDPGECEYTYERDKSEHPKYLFRMSARDMARFGILCRQGGVWNGKRIVPEEWMKESTATYSVIDSTLGAGSGYLWGTILEGGVLEKLMGGTGLFFSGIGVHNLVILDDPDLVMVLRFDTDGDWTAPPRGTGSKLYSMISGARLSQEPPGE